MTLNDLKDYKLVWSDEFDGATLDNSKWNLSEADMEKKDADGNTAVVFKDEEKLIKVEDGKLVLDSYYDEENKVYVAHKSIQTKETMSFKYGYLEVRAKVPFSSGRTISFTAHNKGAIGCDKVIPYKTRMFLFGHGGVFPCFTNSIVKIYENYDENHPFYEEYKNADDSSKYSQTLCLNPPECIHLQYVTEVMEEFKTFGFLWTEKEVVFTVDGRVVTRMTLTQDFLRPSGIDEFKKPHFLNIATNFRITEGNEGSRITPERVAEQIPFEIDYVRLYQKDGEGELNLK